MLTFILLAAMSVTPADSPAVGPPDQNISFVICSGIPFAIPLPTAAMLDGSLDPAIPVALADAPAPNVPVGQQTGASGSAQQQSPATSATPQQQQNTRPAVTTEEQLHAAEHQRIAGVIPAFNTSFDQNAAPLSAGQKMRLSFRSAVDPFQFAIAAVLAGYGQLTDSFECTSKQWMQTPQQCKTGYGQGAEGYFKRFGSGYADAFNGAIIGNGILPALLHQDPRYFRLGEGHSTGRRIWWAALSTVRCKGDSGNWQPNVSNVLGNIIAGGISNVYYPSFNRGVALTFERGFVVSGEGAFGAELIEFWPDVRKHIHHHGADSAAPATTTPATTAPPAATPPPTAAVSPQ